MDENKRAKLIEIGYQVKATCSNCKLSRFSSGNANFGTCVLWEHEHKKHTGPSRELSVNRSGWCKMHDPSEIDPTWVELKDQSWKS